jgi:hypothetical protein
MRGPRAASLTEKYLRSKQIDPGLFDDADLTALSTLYTIAFASSRRSQAFGVTRASLGLALGAGFKHTRSAYRCRSPLLTQAVSP